MADPDCNTTLPKSKTSTYRIWLYMKKRCENPRAKIFQFYGARYVCSICSFAPEGHQPYKSKAERQWNRRVIRHGNELNDIAAQALAEADRVEE